MAGDTYNEITGGIFFSAVIQGRDITVQLPPQVPPALSGPRAGSAAFTGRDDEVRAVLDSLAPAREPPERVTGSRALRAVAVAGMPGIGKTELAVQAAHAALGNGWFPGGALFVDLFGYDPDRYLEAAQALDGLLRALGIAGEIIPADAQDRVRLYTSVLAAYAKQGRPILVLIDNASSSEQAEPLLPADGATGAIVTSRDTLSMLGTRLLDLNVLPRGDAVEMLHRELNVARPGDMRVTDNPGDAAKIAELCGELPLALRIIAALLADNPSRPLAAMADDLSGTVSRLEEMRYNSKAVRATFDLSYRQLDAQKARLFRLLPVGPGPDISSQSAAVLTAMDQTAARHGLEALARAHLIEQGSSYARWRMHDLIRLYADERGIAQADEDEREQARDRLLGYYSSTARAADQRLRAIPGMPVSDNFASRDDALDWLDAERPDLVAAVSMAAGTGRDGVALRLPLALAEYLRWRRRFDDLLATMTVSLESARRLGRRDYEGVALTILGPSLLAVRRLEEAVTACRNAAAICRETGDRRSEGMALTNLGLALQEMRRFDEAVTAHHDAVAIFSEIGDRHSEGVALSNLGLALREGGRPEEAVTACQNAAAIFRETGDRQGEATALANLGPALHEMRRFDEAVTTCQDAAAIFRETGDRHSEGIAQSNLGAALREVGRFDDAITACQDAAAICRETGDRHGEGMAQSNLGAALLEVGRFDEAITACQDAVAIFSETGDRDGESIALNNLEIARSAPEPKRG